jgi:hypothetical protein
MPYYLFRNIATDEYREVFFHMNDAKEYNGDDGTEIGYWVREYIIPNASFDTEIDPYSAKDFQKATAKRGTMGDLWDRSAELSEKRADRNGQDPLKQKFYDDYAKNHNGKKHYKQLQDEAKTVAKNHGITVDFAN